MVEIGFESQQFAMAEREEKAVIQSGKPRPLAAFRQNER